MILFCCSCSSATCHGLLLVLLLPPDIISWLLPLWVLPFPANAARQGLACKVIHAIIFTPTLVRLPAQCSDYDYTPAAAFSLLLPLLLLQSNCCAAVVAVVAAVASVVAAVDIISAICHCCLCCCCCRVLPLMCVEVVVVTCHG